MKCNWFSILVLAIGVMSFSEHTVVGSEKLYLEKQVFMNLTDAKQRWGAKPFSTKAFKDGETQQRAEMAVNLIESKQFIGRTPDQVKDELGPFTGRFWSYTVPAYTIEEGWKKNADNWQLVFLLNENGKVSEVRIHKSCCQSR